MYTSCRASSLLADLLGDCEQTDSACFAHCIDKLTLGCQLKQVANETYVCDLENWRIRILVDGSDSPG